MKKLFAPFPRLLLAALVTAALGAVFSTQKIIAASSAVSPAYAAEMTFARRLSNTLYDVVNFGPLYVIFILIALLIAMGLAGLIARAMPKLALPLFMGAGAVAMAVMLWAMQQVFFGVPIVAGARDGFGLFLQMLAGAIGGLIVWRGWTKRRLAQQAAQV